MAIFYKCDIVDKRQYYTNKYGKKEYLNGNPKNDEMLVTAALLTGKGLDSCDVVYTAYGTTPEGAERAANCFLAVNSKKLEDEGIVLGIGEPETTEGVDLSILK